MWPSGLMRPVAAVGPCTAATCGSRAIGVSTAAIRCRTAAEVTGALVANTTCVTSPAWPGKRCRRNAAACCDWVLVPPLRSFLNWLPASRPARLAAASTSSQATATRRRCR